MTFTALAYQGWTDEEIIAFANTYRLSRHIEEWAKRKDYSWTNRSLRRVREYIAGHPPTHKTSIDRSMCIGSDSRSGYSHTDRHQALRLVTGTQTTRELITTWMNELPTQPRDRTAYRMLKQFKEGGYIQKEQRFWKLTALGLHHTQTKMNYLMPLPKISSKANGVTLA